MLFEKSFLQDTNGDENDKLNEIIDTRRWSVQYDRIFEFEGKLYSAPYSRGATESQDESPYEYEEDMIECPEMEAFEKIVIDYRVKNNG